MAPCILGVPQHCLWHLLGKATAKRSPSPAPTPRGGTRTAPYTPLSPPPAAPKAAHATSENTRSPKKRSQDGPCSHHRGLSPPGSPSSPRPRSKGGDPMVKPQGSDGVQRAPAAGTPWKPQPWPQGLNRTLNGRTETGVVAVAPRLSPPELPALHAPLKTQPVCNIAERGAWLRPALKSSPLLPLLWALLKPPSPPRRRAKHRRGHVSWWPRTWHPLKLGFRQLRGG